MNSIEKRAALADAIREGRFVVAPGVYDMISARVADRMGFEALYMTGYGVAASLLGLPDAGLATYADLQNRVRTFANGTRTPLICDAGYRLRRSAQRSAHGAGLRRRGLRRNPARGPGDSEKVRAHAGTARRPCPRHGREGAGRGRGPKGIPTFSSSREPTPAPDSDWMKRSNAGAPTPRPAPT